MSLYENKSKILLKIQQIIQYSFLSKYFKIFMLKSARPVKIPGLFIRLLCLSDHYLPLPIKLKGSVWELPAGPRGTNSAVKRAGLEAAESLWLHPRPRPGLQRARWARPCSKWTCVALHSGLDLVFRHWGWDADFSVFRGRPRNWLEPTREQIGDGWLCGDSLGLHLGASGGKRSLQKTKVHVEHLQVKWILLRFHICFQAPQRVLAKGWGGHPCGCTSAPAEGKPWRSMKL